MEYMFFVGASGESICLTPRQYKSIGGELHELEIGRSRLRFPQREISYHRYRIRRLGEGAPGAIKLIHSARRELDRFSKSGFRLDRVILGLSEKPKPRGAKQIKWLHPDLRLIRTAEYVVIYSFDDKAKLLRIIKIGYRQ